ncbi:MAG: 2-succinyl-5-enolpyruvyl-6-hydroxy-3-cyclohexene-1-carboxylic-acid synthase [Myxococcaceae bacterium]|nr:2-succinyl-5-enolpyruvyl-6-hydroxy-3-cyclohexene-1-carboxylic-acid synthase [Myxococcaceae bacterium]
MPETLNQRWAATIAGVFAACGVRDVVVAPGSRSTPLALAFADRSDLRCWSCIDERSAAFFALGLAKGSQRPAAVLCTSGTAGAHFLPALIEAAEGGTPLVAVTADRPAELHGFGAPQTIEQRGLFGRWVRDALSLPEPAEGLTDHLVAAVAKLVQRTLAAPRGGVHLNVPFREPLAHPDGLAGPVVKLTVPQFETARGVPDLAPVIEAVTAQERGVIVCGPREREDGFGEAIATLGARLGYPVFAEAASNARFGFPDAVWAFDAMARSASFLQRLAPRVVLRFGGGLTLKAPQAWLDASGARLFEFSDDGAVFDPQHHAEAVFSGDVVAMIRALTPAQARTGPLPGLVASAQRRAESVLSQRGDRIEEALVARALVRALPAGTNLVVSSSMPIRDVDAFASSPERLHVFTNRGVNGIDGVVSTALGVSGATGRPTALLIGDVAALHDLSGWLLASTASAPLVAVVVNNDGGGIFNFLPVAERTPHFERFFATPQPVDFAHVSSLARATLHRPASLEDFARVVRAGLAGGVHLVEVRTERKANVEAHKVLNAALVAAVEASS